MADQIPAQPGQPGQVPPEKAAPGVPPSESERGASPEKIAPVPPVEDSDEPLQGPSAGPPAEPPAPSPSAEAESQAPEGAPESQENFPCPFDEDIGYEIVEPPEGEESDDGFASIPAGPDRRGELRAAARPRAETPRRPRPPSSGARRSAGPGKGQGTGGQAFSDLAGRRRGRAGGGDHRCGDSAGDARSVGVKRVTKVASDSRRAK